MYTENKNWQKNLNDKLIYIQFNFYSGTSSLEIHQYTLNLVKIASPLAFSTSKKAHIWKCSILLPYYKDKM